jgi:hypothetical protein
MAAAETAWKAIGALSGMAAAKFARKAITTGWKRTVGGEPPTNPASPSTTWTEALAWAALSGVAVAVARLIVQRGAAATWRKATGSLPPGLEEVSP